MKELVQGLTATKWWSGNSNPSRLLPETVLITMAPSLLRFYPVAAFIFREMFCSVWFLFLINGWSRYLVLFSSTEEWGQVKSTVDESSAPKVTSPLFRPIPGNRTAWIILSRPQDGDRSGTSLSLCQIFATYKGGRGKSIQVRNNSQGWAGRVLAKREAQAADPRVDGKRSWKDQWKSRWLRLLGSI